MWLTRRVDLVEAVPSFLRLGGIPWAGYGFSREMGVEPTRQFVFAL